MKRMAVVLAILGALLLTACGGSSAVKTVDAASFLQSASAPGVTVIDVRTPGEFAAGHLAGAVNIDVESATFAQRIGQLDKAAAYQVYCHSGRRSTLAADQLSSAGFAAVTNLKGGIADLQAAGGQIVTG